jgi:hypothetical protein
MGSAAASQQGHGLMSTPHHRRTLDVLTSICLSANTRVSKRKLAAALDALAPDRRREVVARLQGAGVTYQGTRGEHAHAC